MRNASFYVLVTACILARKYEWLRNACLAAVLLLPAVAALHGIVLAAVHDNGAVDMDMYGAFQLCAIGILAAPVTVRLSQTYFDRPGRNAIFLWTGILVAGLMSLTVEFYRADPTTCSVDEAFEYGPNIVRCGLDCSRAHSPLRTGSVDDIFIIPEPRILTFGTATLLTAALCVHAILWLLSMLDKILEESSSKYRRGMRDHGDGNEPIEGTNGATRSGMERINEMVKRCVTVAVVPIFMAAGLSILIVGERNFFSKQVSYRTEPIESVGQWAPIAAASLAVIGSLYLLVANDMENLTKEEEEGHCSCSHCHGPTHPTLGLRLQMMSLDTAAVSGGPGIGSRGSPGVQHSSISIDRHFLSGDLTRTTSEAVTLDAGRRRTVARAFVQASRAMGMAAREWTDDSEFRRGRAMDFPEIPGEQYRSRQLSQIRTQYNQPRDENGNVTPAGPARSRASSFVGSVRIRNDETGGIPTSPARTHPSKATTSPTRSSTSDHSARNEGPAVKRHVSRSSEPHVDHLESPNLLEVPRLAFVATRGAFGSPHPEPD
ncbi:CoA-transferase family III [Sarocladium implicatum]|nr:CoA-transferase family III [Sarocladium implicatum]